MYQRTFKKNFNAKWVSGWYRASCYTYVWVVDKNGDFGSYNFVCWTTYTDNLSFFSRQYPCDLCNVAFKAPFQLKRHNRKHTQERNYACTYCEKRFIDKATLDRHFVVHFRERNVECKFCGKRFQSNLGLQNHVGIHTLERKFKCGLCTLAFITSSAASVHRRTHRNKLDNHFHCGDCSMKFLEVIMLKMHLRAVSHTFSVEKN